MYELPPKVHEPHLPKQLVLRHQRPPLPLLLSVEIAPPQEGHQLNLAVRGYLRRTLWEHLRSYPLPGITYTYLYLDMNILVPSGRVHEIIATLVLKATIFKTGECECRSRSNKTVRLPIPPNIVFLICKPFDLTL